MVGKVYFDSSFAERIGIHRAYDEVTIEVCGSLWCLRG